MLAARARRRNCRPAHASSCLPRLRCWPSASAYQAFFLAGQVHAGHESTPASRSAPLKDGAPNVRNAASAWWRFCSRLCRLGLGLVWAFSTPTNYGPRSACRRLTCECAESSSRQCSAARSRPRRSARFHRQAAESPARSSAAGSSAPWFRDGCAAAATPEIPHSAR